ncbi:hypothetical protein [Mesorhizobium sp. CO1-1-8]|uniref:hypothetical protein n=1 Tax=Mesorhizobium sp. CO1-1-8 TaxID=2876631 RepID=UPI001CD0E9E0|nr:hypothetical protein [Mesorhizobium sp. CO1-1-8]MBZ9772310.1 hypothetical protein [Mesorhizobium sp. CO1-1-8]
MTHARLAPWIELSGFPGSLQGPRRPYISAKGLSQALGVKLTNLAPVQVEAVLAFVRDLEDGSAQMKVARAGKDESVHCKEFALCNALHITAKNHHNTILTFALLRLIRRIIMRLRSFSRLCQM